ncbi:MAG TPA: PA2169 family four-helix-bundle protein [Acidimicrobiia bacterium]|nr:PA2169 family four-helix-bundle protein [Acidimicrobiia bacterium]
MQDTTSVIENLLETVENGRKGFAEAAEKLDGDGRSDLAAEMREMSQQRLRMANELRALAAAEGDPIVDEGNGTVAGAMHRSWMALKDALTGDDPHAVLAAAEQGEDHAVSEYRSALEEDLPESVRSVLQRQAGEVKTAHDRVRSLRDAHQ